LICEITLRYFFRHHLLARARSAACGAAFTAVMRHILASICARPDTAGWNRAALPENDDGSVIIAVNDFGTFQ
tara:strand:+ start:179 stop:397 length:219 start_codon:yes stop_codon:yes gene_type:complete